MGEHLKNFAVGLFAAAILGCALVGVISYWKPVTFAILGALLLFAIYMLGASIRRSGKDTPADGRS